MQLDLEVEELAVIYRSLLRTNRSSKVTKRIGREIEQAAAIRTKIDRNDNMDGLEFNETKQK